MELGIIGLGRMGGLMTERLLKGGHAVVGFDRSAEAVDRVKALVRNLVRCVRPFFPGLRGLEVDRLSAQRP